MITNSGLCIILDRAHRPAGVFCNVAVLVISFPSVSCVFFSVRQPDNTQRGSLSQGLFSSIFCYRYHSLSLSQPALRPKNRACGILAQKTPILRLLAGRLLAIAGGHTAPADRPGFSLDRSPIFPLFQASGAEALPPTVTVSAAGEQGKAQDLPDCVAQTQAPR